MSNGEHPCIQLVHACRNERVHGQRNPQSKQWPGHLGLPMTVRFRDGSISNTLFTDSTGHATFNELFPLFNWYVVEADTTRYKATANHVVVDGGGPVERCGPYQGVLSSTYPVGGGTDVHRHHHLF